MACRVAVFFVISGLLVTKSLVLDGGALWPYAVKIPVELGFYVLVPLVFCALVRRSIAA